MLTRPSQNRYQTRKDTPMCFGFGKTSEFFFTCYDTILECTRHFVLMFSYEKLLCALQDGVIWWRIFTSALVKFRTKYRLSDTSGPVSILWLHGPSQCAFERHSPPDNIQNGRHPGENASHKRTGKDHGVSIFMTNHGVAAVTRVDLLCVFILWPCITSLIIMQRSTHVKR
jgi:hypothetical protein